MLRGRRRRRGTSSLRKTGRSIRTWSAFTRNGWAPRRRRSRPVTCRFSPIRAILETIPTQAWSLHPDGTIDYLNQRWHDYTGISREEFRARENANGRVGAADLLSIVGHPDDAEREAGRLLKDILPAGNPIEF